MFGGFTCSKNALIALNIIYILVSFILIGVAGYWKGNGVVDSVPIISGIIVCGVFLLLLSILGLLGAIRHHQVMLFFYMIILFLLFIIQFSISIACLSVNQGQKDTILAGAWARSDRIKTDVQNIMGCCSYDDYNVTHPSCYGLNHGPHNCGCDQEEECCGYNVTDYAGSCGCEYCKNVIETYMDKGLHASGGLGLFFCFTEIVGIVLAFRYRNMPDDSGMESFSWIHHPQCNATHAHQPLQATKITSTLLCSSTSSLEGNI